MKTNLDNNTLTLSLEGRIDSANAAQVEQEALAAVAQNPGAELALDAQGLEYISSAGLRVLMKLRKQAKKALPVWNTSSEIYEIFNVTGFTDLLDVHKALRAVSVEGCELIGSGGFGKVYRIDPETIVKVYNPGISLDVVRGERDTAQKAFLMGVPTAISYNVVRCGESYGAVYELLNARTVAQIMDADRSRVQEMGVKSANLLKELHQIEVEEGVLPNRKATMLEWLEKLAPYLEETETAEIGDFIRSIPDRNTFLHGDYNSKNIMVQGDEFLLIDLGDATIGHPVFDIAGLVLPYFFLPQTPSLPVEEKNRLLGFHMEDAPKMWGVMCSTYFGLTDPAQVKEMTQRIMPYARLLATYQGARMRGFSPEGIRKWTLPGIRQLLLPLIRGAQPLDF